MVSTRPRPGWWFINITCHGTNYYYFHSAMSRLKRLVKHYQDKIHIEDTRRVLPSFLSLHSNAYFKPGILSSSSFSWASTDSR